VGGLERALGEPQPRRVLPDRVSRVHDHARLVEGHPRIHEVAELAEADARVFLEGLRRAALEPAALVLERLRGVPVEEGGRGPYAGGAEARGESPVKLHSLPVDRAAALGEDARPGDGETVGLEPEKAHELDVALEAMVMVAGDGGRVAVPDRSGERREAVPGGFALAVLVPRPLYLRRRGGGAPFEALGKFQERHSGLLCGKACARSRRGASAPYRIRLAGQAGKPSSPRGQRRNMKSAGSKLGPLLQSSLLKRIS